MSTNENSLWEKVIVPLIVTVVAGIVLLYVEYRTGLFSNNPPPTLSSTPTELPNPSAVLTEVPIEILEFTDVTTLTPIAVVEQYYHYLNSAEYDKAWAMFTPCFQRKQTVEDFNGYRSWAINNINRVELSEPITIVEQDELATTVEVYKVTYYLQGNPETIRDNPYMNFFLTRSSANDEWLINGTSSQEQCVIGKN